MIECERHALVVGVLPELRDRYLELHQSVWPQVEATLVACNVRNYSIYNVGDVLFAYYEYIGDDHARDMERIADDPVTHEMVDTHRSVSGSNRRRTDTELEVAADRRDMAPDVTIEIDAHVHVWTRSTDPQPWIDSDTMAVIDRDFTIEDLKAMLDGPAPNQRSSCSPATAWQRRGDCSTARATGSPESSVGST